MTNTSVNITVHGGYKLLTGQKWKTWQSFSEKDLPGFMLEDVPLSNVQLSHYYVVDILFNVLYCLALQNFFLEQVQIIKKSRYLRKYIALVSPLYITNCQESFYDTTVVVVTHLYCITATIALMRLLIVFVKNTIQYISDGYLTRLFQNQNGLINTQEIPSVTFNRGAVDLWNAAKHGDIATMKKLLENKRVAKFVNHKIGEHKSIPMEAAIHGGSIKAIEYLHQLTDIALYNKQNMIFMAIENKHPRILAYLLDNVTGMKELINQKRNGITPLILSTYVKSLNCFRTLVKRGADLTIPDDAPFTVLQIAASNGSLEILRYIYSLRSMKDLSLLYRVNYSPFDSLELAIDNNHWECAKEIMMYDEITVVDEDGNSILWTIYNHEPLLYMDKIVLYRGFNVNTLNSENTTSIAEYLFNFGTNHSLLEITSKLCLHIEAGLHINEIFKEDIGVILSVYEQGIYPEHQMENIIFILYQCGYEFDECKETFQSYETLLNLICNLEMEPLSLQRQCGNRIRYLLKPNAITGIVKLNLPKQILQIITMQDIRNGLIYKT